MYYISDYEKKALNKLIPYLLEFPQIVEIVKYNSSRYQAIEDLLWKIAENLKIDNARGIFLDILANNEVTDIIYTDLADDAFTYGTKNPDKQGYGAGHFYSQLSYISGISKNISEDKMIKAVKAKIIQNNTNGSIPDFTDSLKLIFNANKISLLEHNPLGVSVGIHGNDLEISTSGVAETIKSMLPQCVNLKNIYVSDNKYNLFTYNKNSYYGGTRYPVLYTTGAFYYLPISNSITLNSSNEEYIITEDYLNNQRFLCICASFNNIQGTEYICSCADENYNFAIKFNSNKNFVIKLNNTEYILDKVAEEGLDYTILIYRLDSEIKIYIENNIALSGIIEKDKSTIISYINYRKAIFENKNYNDINSKIYINCNTVPLDDKVENFCNSTYHLLLSGTLNFNDKNIIIDKYYPTCYGEKHILFNVASNDNHLKIKFKDNINKNLTTKQKVFNYNANHLDNRYCYFDGNSYIDYHLGYDNVDCSITDFEISFDICVPFEHDELTILSNFIGYDDNSHILINSENNIILSFLTNEIIDGVEQESRNIYPSSNNIILQNEYANIKIIFKDGKISFYKNNKLDINLEVNETPLNLPSILRIGKGIDRNNFNGFIKNFKFNINGKKEQNIYNRNINIDFTYSLKDNDELIEYENNNVRFITVPQLENNSTNLDIYGNTIINIR